MEMVERKKKIKMVEGSRHFLMTLIPLLTLMKAGQLKLFAASISEHCCPIFFFFFFFTSLRIQGKD